MTEISSPRGYFSGTGVITRKDGTKVPFELNGEDKVSIEQVRAVLGDDAAQKIKTIVEGEG